MLMLYIYLAENDPSLMFVIKAVSLLIKALDSCLPGPGYQHYLKYLTRLEILAKDKQSSLFVQSYCEEKSFKTLTTYIDNIQKFFIRPYCCVKKTEVLES